MPLYAHQPVYRYCDYGYILHFQPSYNFLQPLDLLGMLYHLESPSIRSTCQRANGKLFPVLPELFNLRDCTCVA